MTVRFAEIALAGLADVVDVAGWSCAWHCEEIVTEDQARAAVLDKLPFGTSIERTELLGYGSGVDGSVLLVASIYSHS